MDPTDYSGKKIHYSAEWGKISWANGIYKPGKAFRIYTPIAITLVMKGTKMSRQDAHAVNLTEGYHNFVCDAIIEAGSAADVSMVEILF